MTNPSSDQVLRCGAFSRFVADCGAPNILLATKHKVHRSLSMAIISQGFIYNPLTYPLHILIQLPILIYPSLITYLLLLPTPFIFKDAPTLVKFPVCVV